MPSRDDVVAQARLYLGTPFKHQGRLRGVGIDCAGLVICVAHDLDISTFDYTAYGRIPVSATLETLCAENMDVITIEEATVGDVLLFAFRKDPQHLGIYTGENLIHAYSGVKQVVEHPYDLLWQTRTMGAFRYRGLD